MSDTQKDLTQKEEKSLSKILTPKQAKLFNEQGATLLCLGVPAKTLFGIDYMTFTVGANFQGVKMIPCGPHFIHSSVDADGTGTKKENENEEGNGAKPRVRLRLDDGTLLHSVENRMGFFIWLKPSQIEVFEWNPTKHFLAPCSDADQCERLKLGLHSVCLCVCVRIVQQALSSMKQYSISITHWSVKMCVFSKTRSISIICHIIS